MMSAIEWAEKYRPSSLKDIVGNKKAVHDLRTWAEEWLSGVPEQRAVVLEGPAGVGKTSGAHALARDMGWEVIEMNASDQRTAGVIEKVAGSAASMDTFFGGKRLIILDEADNLHGNADRGGMRAIAGIIKTSLQPIVLIVNDVYGLTPTIRDLSLEIKFGSVQSRSMAPALKKICDNEGISCSIEAIQQIAENAGGDLRSAVNDLQAAACGKKALEVEDICTAGRDVKENIFKAMQRIFKSTDCKKALEVTRGLDESPEDLVHWIDENLPIQYASKDGNLGDTRTGFDYLSKADLYLGRVKKRQNYHMWRYASMLMVCGAVISKTRAYPGFIKYQQPSLWRRLGQTRSKRDLRDNVASKVGEHSFESMRYSRSILMELYSRMIKDERAAVEITADLGLELEELMYLSGSTKVNKKLQKIYDEAQELYLQGYEAAEESEFFKTPAQSPATSPAQSPATTPAQSPATSPAQSPIQSPAQSPTTSKNDKRIPSGCTVESPELKDGGLNGKSETPWKKRKIDSSKPENTVSDSSKSESKPIEDEITSMFSKRKANTKSELAIEKVSEPNPANLDAEAEKTPKKTEAKSQKSLFDF